MSRPTNPWRVLVVLCLGQAIPLLDTTAVNVAIPTIIHDLNAGLDQILWVINGYTLTYATLLVTGGRLGDLYGQKRMFLSGLSFFVFSSALCGLVQNPEQLIAARLCQGVGAALLTPPVLAILTHIFPPERRGFALGVWGGLASVPVAVGPTLGGLIVSGLGWRWVFYINLPLGVAAIVFTWLIVPELRGERRIRLDVLGTILLTSSLALLAFGLIEGGPSGWGTVFGPVSVPMVLVAGFVLLAAFVYVERGRQDRDPLMPFAVIRNWNFTLMSIVVATLPGGLGAMLLLVTFHLQSGLGLSAFEAGLTVAAISLVSGACAPLGGRLTSRYGGKYVLIAGFLVWAAGIGYLALTARPGLTGLDVLPGLLISGVGLGLVFSPPGTIAMHDIDPAMSGAASGLFNTTRLGGGLLGVAATGTLLQAQLTGSLAESARRHAEALPPGDRTRFVEAFTGADPPDLSQSFPDVPRELIDGLTRTVYHEGVLEAVRFTYLLPMALLLAGALGTLAARVRRKAESPTRAAEPSRSG